MWKSRQQVFDLSEVGVQIMPEPRLIIMMAALVCLVPAQASAATLTIQDVKPGFFAHQQIYWVVSHDWRPHPRARAMAPRLGGFLNERRSRRRGGPACEGKGRAHHASV